MPRLRRGRRGRRAGTGRCARIRNPRARAACIEQGERREQTADRRRQEAQMRVEEVEDRRRRGR